MNMALLTHSHALCMWVEHGDAGTEMGELSVGDADWPTKPEVVFEARCSPQIWTRLCLPGARPAIQGARGP